MQRSIVSHIHICRCRRGRGRGRHVNVCATHVRIFLFTINCLNRLQYHQQSNKRVSESNREKKRSVHI